MIGMNSMGILTALSTFRWMLLNNKVNILCVEIAHIYIIFLGKMRYLTLRQSAVTMVGCSWVWSVSLSFAPLIGWEQYLQEGNGMM